MKGILLQQALRAYGADLDGALARFLNDTELYEQCYQQFMNDENFAQLADAMQALNYQRAFEASHTIKGVAGNMGLTPLYRAICTLVEALRAHQYDDAVALYAAIPPEIERLREFCK